MLIRTLCFLVLLYEWRVTVLAQRRISSPCPDVFQYEAQRMTNGNVWHGRLVLSNDVELHGIWIQIKLDKEVDALGNWFGEATSGDNIEFTIRNPDFILYPDRPTSVPFFVKYKTSEGRPSVVNIRLNGKIVCNVFAKPPVQENKLHISKVKTTKRPIVPLNPDGSNPYISTSVDNGNTGTGEETVDDRLKQSTTVGYSEYSSPSGDQSDRNGQPETYGGTGNKNQFAQNSQNRRNNTYNGDSTVTYVGENNKPNYSGTREQSTQTAITFTQNNRGNDRNKHPSITQPNTSNRDQTIQTSNTIKPQATYPGTSNINQNPQTANSYNQNNGENNQQGTSNRDKNTQTTNPYIQNNSNKEQASQYGTSDRDQNVQNYNNQNNPQNDRNQQQNTDSGLVGSTENYNNNAGNLNQQISYNTQNSYNIPNIDNKSESASSYNTNSNINSNKQQVTVLNSGFNANKNKDQFGNDGTTEGSSTDHQATRTTSRHQYYDQDFFSSDFAPTKPSFSPLSSLDSRNNEGECGLVKAKPRPLITYGEQSSEGEWPWHAALYHAKGIDWTYICGASLMTKKHLITAAHCVTRPRSLRPVDAENLLVYLGKTNLRNFGTAGIQDRPIASFVVHPEFNVTNFKSDIAVLTLAKDVEVTDFVRPLCLWSGETGLEAVVGQLGSVVGWGLNENGLLSQNLLQAKMPVVPTVTCLYSNPEFFGKFTSDSTFCAGFRNGTSVCNGDSGGGMVFKKPGTNSWQLRGLVSISIARQGEAVCDTNHYVVFTDVAKYIPWLKVQLEMTTTK